MLNRFLIPVFVLMLDVTLSRAATPRVPAAGRPIPDAARAELTAAAADLGREISSLRRELAAKPELLALLPDVEIYHKAVDWPLRYDEFHRSNDVASARVLLKQGAERARQLHAGAAPWLTATGLVVRGYRSRIDGSVQPYGLVVPATFSGDPKKPRRLDVWLHGRDNDLTELKFITDRQRSAGEFTPPDTIVLHPYGRYCNAFKFAGETDVFEALAHVRQHYAVDGRRMAMRGFSMGGAGAWHLAAHHPSVWAVATPGAGFAETAEYTGTLVKGDMPSWERVLWQLYDATDYAGNFFNLPVIAYNGTEDKQRQAADVMQRAMEQERLVLPRVWGTNVGHKYTPEAKKELTRLVDDILANPVSASPEVRFTTRTLRYNQFAGGELLGLQQHWRRADIIVKERRRGGGAADDTDDPIVVRTTNVTAFALSRSAGARRIAVVDGRLVRPRDAVRNTAGASWLLFERGAENAWSVSETTRPPKFASGKRPGLQGPIDDAFVDSFVMVRPTGTTTANTAAWVAAAFSDATNQWRAQFRGDAPVKDDGDINDDDIATRNLVLWGDPQSNHVLGRIVERLPIRWTRETIRLGGKALDGSTHIVALICRNPLNPEHYVVLNNGFTFAAAASASNAQQTPKLPDYAVFSTAQEKPVIAGFFDEQWRVE